MRSFFLIILNHLLLIISCQTYRDETAYRDENWKNALDEDFLVATVLMDLSKAFDCIPHDELIAELHAYGYNERSITFVYFYLKLWKQSVKIYDTLRVFQTLISGVSQGSTIGPTLFNIPLTS